MGSRKNSKQNGSVNGEREEMAEGRRVPLQEGKKDCSDLEIGSHLAHKTDSDLWAMIR
jgi:hypothetical protein